jgi:hypothetical protein
LVIGAKDCGNNCSHSLSFFDRIGLQAYMKRVMAGLAVELLTSSLRSIKLSNYTLTSNRPFEKDKVAKLRVGIRWHDAYSVRAENLSEHGDGQAYVETRGSADNCYSGLKTTTQLSYGKVRAVCRLSGQRTSFWNFAGTQTFMCGKKSLIWSGDADNFDCFLEVTKLFIILTLLVFHQ